MAKATNTKTTAKTTTTSRDKWGSRAGTISHAINAVFINAKGKPVTVDKIVEGSGCTKARARLHAQWLVERDRVVKLKDGTWKTKPTKTKKTTA